ncbi:MAG: ATP-binding cassette domain-containing protein [Anaeroplasma sp.]
MIKLENVSKYYTANGITNLGLRNISLSLNKNEIIAITGDSGSGKSTLLNVITKIDTFDEGEIYYKGNETSYFSISDMDDFRKNKVGFIFQNYNIIDSYTVLENVMIPLLLLGKKRKEAKEKALELINDVGLKGKEKNRGSKLSGGEKQRCVIARALASDCEILACDEPTGNLDSKTGKEIIELIHKIAKDKLVLIVTHDIDSFTDIITRKIRLNDGEVVEDIVYKDIEEDKDEVLDLDYKPLAKKIAFTVAKNNVLFTPKKTIFLASIFFVISLIVFLLFQVIHSATNEIDTYNSYANKQENRLYVYNKNHQELNMNEIEEYCKDYVINPFYEDKTIEIYSYNIYESFFYNDYVPSIKIEDGRYPNNDKEMFIVLPKGSSLGYYDDALYKELFIESTGESFTLVGYGTSSDINKPTITKNQKIKETMFNQYFNLELYDKNNNLYFFKYEKSTDFELILPNSWKNLDARLILNDLYTITGYKLSYQDVSDPTLRYNDDTFVKNNVFEVSVYTNKISSTKTKLKNLGFMVDQPSKLDEGMNIEVLMANLFSYGLMFMASTVLIFVFYITYFVLARVYSSKKKDYEILRTLGVTKKDMRFIVSFEVMGIGIFVMLLAYITGLVLIYNVPKLFYLRGITLGTSLIYFIILFIFVYAVGHRFNKKLFKFSVSKSLKGDDLND